MKKALAFAAAAITLGAIAADLENEYCAITFGEKGEFASIKSKPSGRELVKPEKKGAPMFPFAVLTLDDQQKATSDKKPTANRPTQLTPTSFKRQGDRFAWGFGDHGALMLEAKPFDGGWVFKIVKSTLKDYKHIEFMRVKPACNAYKGGYVRMFSDDDDGVAIRAFDFKLEMNVPNSIWSEFYPVRAWSEDEIVGMRIGLSAGPKAKMQKMLQGMTFAYGGAYSKCGGAWCLGAPENRNSYMFSYYEDNFDEWLDMLKLTGIGTLHFHLWYSSTGNYTLINEKKFPGGLKKFKEMADRVHDAGYRVSIHTLSALIAGPNPWTGPIASPDLLSVFQYTTLNDLKDGVTELLVKERPNDDMDKVVTYGSLGNYLRIGGEIIQYSDIRREPPYAFTGITRGAYNTKVVDHPAGETAHYCRARYFGLYPDPESKTMDEIAEKLGTVYNTIGADRIFFDGAEGIGPRYGKDGSYKIATMVDKMYRAFDTSKKPCQMEMSCYSQHQWWLRANAGVIDGGKYALKIFDRNHLRDASIQRKANLLEPQLGWWKPGDYTDETDYYGAHAAGIDGAISVYGPIRNLNKGPLGYHWQHEMTVLGWYEHFRMAMAFTDEAMAKLRDLNSECRLRQAADGEWRLESIEEARHRVTGAATKTWNVEREVAGPAEPVIYILGGTEAYTDTAAIPVVNGSVAGEMKLTTSGKKVTGTITKKTDPRRGDCFRFEAFNESGVTSNAWINAKLDFGEKRKDFSPSDGFGFWVKGDGKGALLDVRVKQAKLFGNAPSDSLVRIDFTGWKYFEFLSAERDAYEIVKHIWPFKPDWGIFSSVFHPKDIDEVDISLAELPLKENKEVFLDQNATAEMEKSAGVIVEISEIRAVQKKELQLSDMRLVVNGEKIALPFDSAVSGDRIKLLDGIWELRDNQGELKAKAKTGDAIELKRGENKLAFLAETLGGDARADVKFLCPVKSVKALKPRSEWPKEWAWHGDFEAMTPVDYCPKKGAADLPNLKVRPGERAEIEVQIVGEVIKPYLEYTSANGWKRVMLNGSTANKRSKCETGLVLEGVRELRFGCEDKDSADCRVEIIKHYTTQKKATDKAPPLPKAKKAPRWQVFADKVNKYFNEKGYSAEEKRLFLEAVK